MLNKKYFRMPHWDEYKKLREAILEYYWLCFPDMDEDELYDLMQGPMIEIEQTVKRLYKQPKEEG